MLKSREGWKWTKISFFSRNLTYHRNEVWKVVWKKFEHEPVQIWVFCLVRIKCNQCAAMSDYLTTIDECNNIIRHTLSLDVEVIDLLFLPYPPKNLVCAGWQKFSLNFQSLIIEVRVFNIRSSYFFLD